MQRLLSGIDPTVLWLTLFAFAGFWLNSWAVPLFDLDEGAFTAATREMFERGDFLMTYLDGAPRYDKPILIYWLQAASVSVFGWSEFALRLPSMLAASAWMWVVYRFVNEVSGSKEKALFAAGSLALSPVPGLIGHAATADALLNLLLALTLLDLWRWFDRIAVIPAQAGNDKQRNDKLLLLRVYLWIGLGLLTKGPVAVALPVMVVLPFALLTNRWRDALKAAFFIPGWLLALAVFLPWAVLLTLKDGGDFFKHFLLDHNVGRYSETMESHGGKLWYYVAALPLIVLPFAAWLPSVLKQVRGWKTEPRTLYLLLWFGVVFVLFSTSKTQLPHYLLYGCTPLFVLFGLHAEAIKQRWVALLPATIFIALLCALPTLLPQFLPDAHHAYDRGIVETIIASVRPTYYMACIGAAVIVLLALIRPNITPAMAGLRGGLAVSLAVWCGVLPLLAAGQQVPVQQAAAVSRQLGLPVVAYRITMPSFSVYRGSVTPHRTPVTGEIAFTRKDRIADLAKETNRPQTVVFRSGGVALIRIE
ncbi:MAG: glycosyltransferase family 39 protein [Stagnimonas sp.]|nr:glycosyltransferase family 39 protein [Stagnimonas sp.]